MLFLIYSSILLRSKKGKSEVKMESEEDDWKKTYKPNRHKTELGSIPELFSKLFEWGIPKADKIILKSVLKQFYICKKIDLVRLS